MWTEQQRKSILEFEDAAEKAGGYVDYVPGRPLVIDADYRAMSKYCTEKGIKPMDLTEDEYNKFLYDERLVYGQTASRV